MKRHLFGSVGAIAMIGFALGCVGDPTDALRAGIAGVEISRTYLELEVGASAALTARTFDLQGNSQPTLATVTSADPSIVVVTVDTTVTGKPLPSVTFTVTAVGYGKTTVTASAGTVDQDIVVQTWPAAIELGGLPETMRSGETAGPVTVTPVDVDGNPVSGVPADSIIITDDTPERLALSQATLMATAISVGGGRISAVGPGGSTGDLSVTVIAGVPDHAAFEPSAVPALGAGDSTRLQVVVYDAADNENSNVSELLSQSISSSNTGVVTVRTEISDTTLFSGEVLRRLFVWVKAVGAGTSEISGSVTTPAGTITVPAVTATVLAPVITVASPAGLAGATITINGSGFTATGYDTYVLVDGEMVGNFTVVSDNQITAQMPTLLAGTYDLEVTVGGVPSNADSWTQTASFDEAASEPNDAIGQEAPISLTFEFAGTTDYDTDFGDLFQFTVSESDLVIDIELSWGDGNDLDVIVYPIGTADPGTYDADLCEYHAATTDNPEVATCTLGAAGTYTVEVMNWGAGTTTYSLTGTIRP